MYQNDSSNELLQRGRKKTYSAKEGLELCLPNSKSDGVLEKGDLIYVVQKINVNGEKAFRFIVLKFSETPKQSKIYCAEEKYFEPYLEKKSNTDGEVASNNNKNSKTKYVVPSILGLGGGVFGYMVAKKYGKRTIPFALAGLVVGVAVGIFIIKYNEKK